MDTTERLEREYVHWLYEGLRMYRFSVPEIAKRGLELFQELYRAREALEAHLGRPVLGPERLAIVERITGQPLHKLGGPSRGRRA